MKLNVFIVLLCNLLFIQHAMGNFNDAKNCRQLDSLVLVLFNESITSGLTWDMAQPIETWQGVSLNENGCVSELNLSAQQLTGTINPFINRLTEIETLDLSENMLSGEIPESIGNLKNLSYLSLMGNNFVGKIPETIGNLGELRYLSLSSNDLTGIIPSSLSNLTNLKHLDFGGNDLSGNISESLGNLSSLIYLNLCENELTGLIPANLGSLSNLDTLYLMDNKLYGCYFKELKNLCDLSSRGFVDDDDDDDGDFFGGNNFDVPWYSFCEFDEGICNPYSPCRQQDSLTLLKLYNQFEGLNWNTSLSINKWEGVSLNGDGCVDGIFIDDQTITNAQLIPEIADFKDLKALQLSCNLTGSIPTEIVNLAQLELLNLSGNNLTGSISTVLDSLVNLESVNLSNNNLSGCFPYKFLKLCDDKQTKNAFNNNNFDATWEEFCGFATGSCCNGEREKDLIFNASTPFFEDLYEAENVIEIVGDSHFMVAPYIFHKNNTIVFKAGKHIEINSNFTSDSTTNLILTVEDSCK